MANSVTATVRGSDHQNRFEKSLSSGFSSSSSSGISGSNDIPQIGQSPGPIWRISGCIGQVYSVVASPAGGFCAGGVDAREEVP